MIKRPRPVAVTRILFWIYAIGVLLFQAVYTIPRVGVVDYFSIAVGALVLVAAIRLSKPIRNQTTFLLSLLALLLIIARGILTVRTQFDLRSEFPEIQSSIIGSMIFSVAIIALAIWFYRASSWFDGEQENEGEQGVADQRTARRE